MLLVSLGGLYYKDGTEYYFENSCVSDSGLIEAREELHDYCKDQGCMLDDDDVPDDDAHELDETETSYDRDDAEKSDDEDSHYKFE